MNSIDKLFVAFITAIVILGVAAFALDFSPTEAGYREGTAPEDVVHNYLVALQEGDFQRAYEQLSPQLRSYPKDLQFFIKQVHNNKVAFPLDDEEVALTVLSSDVGGDAGSGWATVEVSISYFYNSGPFANNQYSRTFDLELEEVDGVWKIADGEMFFFYCWVQRVCTY